MCQISAKRGYLHESGRNCLTYLKRGRIERRGGETKISKRRGS